MTSEWLVEAYLRKRVKELGGFYRKVVYQGRSGSPDDWCFFSGGRLLIIECKSSTGRLSAVQKREIQLLKKKGFKVAVVYSKEDVDEVLDAFCS